MNGLLNTLAANWHKANLRTRYALVVLFAIVLWLGVERLQQAAGAAIARNVQAQENLARVSGGDAGMLPALGLLLHTRPLLSMLPFPAASLIALAFPFLV